jgi:hypothetical protein
MSIRSARTVILMSACAIATASLVSVISQAQRSSLESAARLTQNRSWRSSPAAIAAASAAPGHRWFVGDGWFVSSIDPLAQAAADVPADWASSLHIANPGAAAAHVVMTVYRTGSAPSHSAIEVPAGRLYTIDLARRRDIPRGSAFWIAVEADQPVFPQLVHQTFRPWDLVPEGLTMVTPQPGPLDDSHAELIYPDLFQGGTPRWIEQETITLLNPWPTPAAAHLTFKFSDGRPIRTHDVSLPAERVTVVDLPQLFPDEGTPLDPVLSRDFSITIGSTEPVVTQQTRRVYWRGRKEVTSLSARVPLRQADALEAREWYYAGGWNRDLHHLPRDGQTDRTWQLLFTYPVDTRARTALLRPLTVTGSPTADPLPLATSQSDLQWLHQSPWRERFGGDDRPWGFALKADGPIAPVVTTAEFEAWSQAMPGGMGAGNLVSDVAAGLQESWLGVAFHGGADYQPAEWSAAWQIVNPGVTPLRTELTFFTADAPPIVHHVTVAPGRVVRVNGGDVPGLPMDRPFTVRARGDQPFAAFAWVRVNARGQSALRAMSSTSGVAVKLETAPLVTDTPRQ